jgi:hypothetical protein
MSFPEMQRFWLSWAKPLQKVVAPGQENDYSKQEKDQRANSPQGLQKLEQSFID